MYFVGLDLAWGEKNQTGVAVVDADGRLLHVGVAQDDASIRLPSRPYIGDDCLVAIDAPLIVTNPTGHRPGEAALNRDFHRFDAGAHPAIYRQARVQESPWRAIADASASTWTRSRPRARRAIEVYPHPATVVLFGLEKTLKYKRGAVRGSPARAAAVDDADRGTRRGDPRLRVNRNVAWVELRKRVEAATRPSQLDRDEDPVDAVMCAYVGLYWYHRPDDVTIYGDFETGYIVTPTLPRRYRSRSARQSGSTQTRRTSAAAPRATRRLLEKTFNVELTAIREAACANPARNPAASGR